MKSYAVWIFFSIVSIIYFLVNWYVVSRGVKALSGTSFQLIFKWSYWILSASFLIGQILERGQPSIIARVVTHIGSVWLAVFLYLLLFTLLVDLVRILDARWHFIPNPMFGFASNGVMIFALGWLLALSIVSAGWINARYPRINEVVVNIDKPLGDKNELKIALATDIHMGAMIGKKRIREMVEKINSQEVDMVLLAGDLVDHNPLYVKAANMGPEFENIQAPLGTYAITGNHEFIGHAEVSIDYLKQYGIQYIRDSILNVGSVLQIAGRDDRERRAHDGVARKPIEEVMQHRNPDLPLILMDHQPVEYGKAQEFDVDLMVSGHTHKGQLWPFGYITRAIFENDYGLIRKGKTWFYTSSGYGTWGPPVRTGNRPELVVIHLKGKE
jgi:predicted MPP superfamily phosphohydrolase